MSPKEKRVMEAHRLRYMENLTAPQIAKRIGVTADTIRHYFSESESKKYKRFYSDQELFQLHQSLEQDVRDGNKLANNLLARAIQSDDASPSDLIRAAKEAQKIRERKIDMLQKLMILESPEDSYDDEEADSVREDLVKGLQKKQEQLVEDE